MAGGESLGNLYFDLGLRDDAFEASFKSKLEKYKKMELNVGVKIDSESAKKAISSTTDALKGSSKVDFSSTITPLVTRLKEARSELNVFKELMSETKNIGKKLEIRTNIKDTEKELEALMSQIKLLEKVQSSLSVKTSPLDLIPRRSLTDEKELSDKKAYWAEEEKLSKRNADNKVSDETKKQKAIKDTANEERKASVSEARVGSLDSSKSKNLAAEALLRQKIAKEVEATALAHKRNEAFGTQSQSRIRSNAEFTNKTLLSQRQIAMQLSNQFGTMFSIYAVERFVKKLAEVRGEFELQKVSLRAILQDAPAADAIFEQIKQLSVKSPFTFKDLIGYTKQLAAFSIPVNELYDTMKNLADVSAGLGVDMGRITLAFGQVRAASVLRGQELRQFTEAGIPLVEELAKKFTKLTGVVTSNGDVFEKISKRMVSFEMVKEIFDDMTSAGGKFYNMQELQASTLKGKISNLADAFDLALNDIGESNEGVLKGSLDLTTELLRNWENVAGILATIILTYGAYNAAVAVNTAITKLNTQTGIYNIATRKLSKAAIIEEMIAQSALNKAILANPYAILIAAIVGVIGVTISLTDATSYQERAQARLNELTDEASKNSDDQKQSAERLLGVINSETETIYNKIKALDRLKELYPNFVKNMDFHAVAALGAEEQQRRLNEAVDDMDIASAESKLASFKEVLAELRAGDTKATDKAAEILGYGFWKSLNTDASEYLPVVEELISKMEQQKQLQLDIQAQAKFDLLPQEEKVKIWEKQIEQLEAVRAGMISAAKSSDYLSTSLVKPKEKWDLMAETDMFKLSLTSADFLNKKIFDLKNLVDGGDVLPDTREYWENQLTSAKGVWDALSRKQDLASGNKSKWSEGAIEADKNIKIAEKALLAWDRSTKSQKKSEDAAAKALEIKIGLLKESYEIYKKLAEIKGKDAAKEMIATDPAFARYKNLPGGAKVPTSTTELSNAIAPVIAASNQNSAGVKKMYRENAKLGMEGYIEGVKESSDKIFKTLNDAISDYKPKYDLYEKLLGLTGDRKKSSQLAFGKDAVDDYETFLRNQYAKMPGASFFSELTPPAEGATEEVKKAWKDLVEYIQSKKLGKIEYFEQMIAEASSTSDKIKKIELDRERDIADAEKSYATDPERKAIAVAAAKSKAEAQINEIQSQLFQLSPLYAQIFEDLGRVSERSLDGLLERTKALMTLAKTKGEVRKDSDGKTTGYFLKKGTKDDLSGLEIPENILIRVADYNKLLERTSEIINKIDENPFRALFNPPKSDTPESPENKAKRISTAIKGIADIASSVSGEIGSIMDSFGASDESQAALKNITDVATGAAGLAAGIISGNPVEMIKGIAKVITGLNAMHDAKYEKQIKEYQKQIDATAKSYDKLTESLSRKTEASKVDAQAEEYNLLQREKSLLEAQKRAEEAKKKTDQSKIDDYNKQIEDATKKQQELALNTINYILGGSIGAQSDSWAKTLTDAMDTAFQNGTDAAKAWGDSVDTIVRDIAKNFIVNSFLGNQLQGWLEAASADWTDANKNINQSAIEADLQGFSLFAKSLEPATEAALKALSSIYGDGKTGASGSGLTGEIKGVTEDTAQRLASLLNAIRQDSGVNRLAFAEMKNILSEFNRGSIEANSYLNKINENTRLTAENTAAIVRAFNDVTGVGSQGKALRIL